MSETQREVFEALLETWKSDARNVVCLLASQGVTTHPDVNGMGAEWLARFGRASADGWISVEERLPEVGETVWAWTPLGGVEALIGGPGDPGGWIALHTYLSLPGVTHWRPLPPPPGLPR